MLAVIPAPEGYEVVIATFDKPDAHAKLEDYKRYWLHWPTNRSIKNLLKNTVLAFRVIGKERPHLIVSTGAAAAVPFFFVGKFLGRSTNVFIECIDRISMPTLTAKLVRPVTDLYICQWETQLSDYKKRLHIGRSR